MASDFGSPPHFGPLRVTPRSALSAPVYASVFFVWQREPVTDPGEIANINAQLSDAQAAYDKALAAFTAAQGAVAPAASAYAAAQEVANDADQAVTSANQTVATLQRRAAATPPTATSDDVTAAQTAAATAAANAVAPDGAAATAGAAWQNAQGALGPLMGNVSSAYSSVNRLQALLDDGTPYIENTDKPPTGWYVQVQYPDSWRDPLVYIDARVQTRGRIVSSNTAGSYSYDDIDPETLALADAVQLPDTSWLTTGQTHDLPAAAGDAYALQIYLALPDDPAILPAPNISAQCSGAERARQGWSEFMTPAGQEAPRRYLTMTASNSPGTPDGITYSGSLAFAAPPAGYHPQTYFPLPGDPIIYPGSYGPTERPLAIYSTLSPDVTGGADGAYEVIPNLYPETLTAVTDDATILSATTRLMSQPPGLLWTLTDEQLPSDLAAQVQAAISAGWNNTELQMCGSGGANFQTDDGDYVAAQRGQYKLQCICPTPPLVIVASPPPAVSTTFYWWLKRRDLDTGVVTMEAHTTVIAFPIATTPAGGGPVSYTYSYIDPDYTPLEVSANESVQYVTPSIPDHLPLGNLGG